ncbi:MAG TPA: hypothetical protein VFZ18_09035, partial [Longimicrobiaceae bacterium]
LTQWMNQSIRKLESGFTPVALRHHVVILGWTSRTAAIVRELVLAEGRLQRFLRRHGARGLRIAILAEEIGVELRQELRDRLGRLWNERQTVLRTGTPLRIEHLRRVDFGNAAAILIPASDFRHGGASADARIIKTLLSMGGHRRAAGGELPLVVAEIFDARKVAVARAAYPGRIELLASDSIVSRLIAQNVRSPGLSHVYGELLTNGRGNQIYAREHPQFVGTHFHSLGPCFPAAILLGVVRPSGSSFSPVLSPPANFRLAAGDRLAMLARRHADTEPADAEPLTGPRPEREAPRTPAPRPPRRVLVLGWSHRVPALIREFDSYANEEFQIDILSALPVTERRRNVDLYEDPPRRVRVTQLEGDYVAPADLRRVDPGSYDNIVIVGSDWLESGEESDARTILGSLMVRAALGSSERTELLVELLDPENLSLFRRQTDSVIVTPIILSHMLAQVALRPELRAIFDELFGPGGAEISFAPASAYGIRDGEGDFEVLERAATARGEIALGIRRASERGDRDGGVVLNPHRDRVLRVDPGDEVVVLRRDA